eukprot:2132307-Rhodomonas_salina.1
MLVLKIAGADREHLQSAARHHVEHLRHHQQLSLSDGDLPGDPTHDPSTGLLWAVAGHDAASVVEELCKDPPPTATLDAMAKARGQGRSKLLMVYSGQGSALDGWWLEAYETNAVFAETLDGVCQEAWTAHGVELRGALWLDGKGSANEAVAMALQQPAIYAVQVALTKAWAACGVTPDAVIGHSFGEYAAA